MNTRAAALLVISIVTIGSARSVAAQGTYDPPPPPTATAESENWYISGQPIAVGGAVYYPSGPITHFVRSEMVASGMFERVPVYRRTTQEPGSIVYIPLAGGLVRPYERRRSGDLAGTVGSTVPGFPVILPAEQASVSTSSAPAVPPAVPRAVGTSGFSYNAFDRAFGTPLSPPEPVPPAESEPIPVGMTGANQLPAALLAPTRPIRTRVETVQRPVGLNAVFLLFQNARWFAAGPAVEFSSDTFTRIGEHRGFPVYQRAGRADLIFVSHIEGTPHLVVPYQSR